MTKPRLLLVDDERDLRWVLRAMFEAAGFSVDEAESGGSAATLLATHDYDVVLSDVRMPDGDGVALLRQCRRDAPDVPVVLLSAVEDLETAVGAMKLGAYDYLAKPFDRHRLLSAVQRAAEKRGLAREVVHLRERLDALPTDLGRSPPARELDRLIDKVARCQSVATLLVGESGVGKEVAARELHRRSAFAAGPFVAIDCGAVPEALLESQLFGHRRGAFTGADSDRPGLFLAANGGTLFLDEIGNLPLAMQPRLLRALQERAVVPLGSTEPQAFAAQLVCASNVDLPAAVQAGTFRLDLFHRIAEVTIELPPLRKRPADISHFARRFLADACTELRREVRGFAPAAEQALLAHHWPGNLRELRNAVRRATLLCTDGEITVADLDLDRGDHHATDRGAAAPGPDPTEDRVLPLAERLRRAVDALEAKILRDALHTAAGNKAAAARALQVDYTTLHRKLKRHGLGTMADVP